MATGPKVAESPLELLTNDGTRPPSLLTQIWGPLAGGFVGFIGGILGNYLMKRPMTSGIQRTVLFTVGGAYLGKLMDNYRNDQLAERDAVYRHYIQLHPDDFPPFKREKYGDILQPWIPIR